MDSSQNMTASSAGELVPVTQQLAFENTATQTPTRLRGDGASCLIRLRQHAQTNSLAFWMARYIYEEVDGSSVHTVAAKARDLELFYGHFVALNHHGELRAWRKRDTLVFVAELLGKGRAPNSVNRALATLKHFARWMQVHKDDPMRGLVMPTQGVKEVPVDEPDCKKLEMEELRALFAAAQELVTLQGQSSASRPRRNQAALALLFYTGIRISELVALSLDQYRDGRLVNVLRKGRGRFASVYLTKACRDMLDDYLTNERHKDIVSESTRPLLAAAKSGKPIARQDVARSLAKIAEVASKNTRSTIHLHPHRLRHTFGAAYREKTGSDTETAAALGHQGLKYVGRYVRRSTAERERDMDSLYDLI